MASPSLAMSPEQGAYSDRARVSQDSLSSVSTTSLIFERIERRASEKPFPRRSDTADLNDQDPFDEDVDNDVENARLLARGSVTPRRGMDRRLCHIIAIVIAVVGAAWVGALVIYISRGSYKHSSTADHDPTASVQGSGKTVTLDQVLSGEWYAASHRIKWIRSPDGEDGLLLLQGDPGKDYLVVEDVRASDDTTSPAAQLSKSRTLIKDSTLQYGREVVVPQRVWPSPDLKRVLISTKERSVWRYSFTATYWILDVETQMLEPLDPLNATATVQGATWSPQSDAIAFVKDHNLYLRKLDNRVNKKVTQITRDGNDNIFYGIPDWVYEEEVVSSNLDTYWSADGKFIAFKRYDDTGVAEYPVQFFIKHPDKPESGEKMLYPYVESLKYPKPGTTNPTVTLHFYDVEANEFFAPEVEGEFPDDRRVISTLVWAGNKAIVKEVNRSANLMRIILVDPKTRTGLLVRNLNATEIDGGWFDNTHPRYIPADPENGRPEDGYIDLEVHGFGDHLAYYTPLDNHEPVMLTSGDWEVTGQASMMAEKPLAVDLDNNLVYFTATKESSIQRHIYSVRMDGSDLQAVTNTSEQAYYGMSFSDGAGYALLNYQGPGVPWYKVVSTPSNPSPKSYERVVEDNTRLKEMARKHELPVKRYGTINVDGFDLNYVERLPPHFDENKKHPVLFYQYSGPKSQEVTVKFEVDFQSAMASLGYIVVTVDGRGTGFIGRKARSIIHGHLGRWESHDQIAAGKIWAAKKYVDPSRLAIWGWSFGGYNTLKTLEVDAGETFSYGMAVAPVTDWRFYDSIYTERYMGMPQENQAGYDETAVHNVSALARNVRFMVMHGVADDNVHLQNTLTLLDALNLEGAVNFDVHVFPDSNHSISFHRARKIVYERLRDWLVNAFNGEWIKTANPTPNPDFERTKERER